MMNDRVSNARPAKLAMLSKINTTCTIDMIIVHRITFEFLYTLIIFAIKRELVLI